MSSGDPQVFVVAQRWDGRRAPSAEWVRFELEVEGPDLVVRVEAPFHGDAPPPHAPGSTPGLWEHEVVELFLLGPDDRYLELELGPHGHFLVLELHGVRNIVREHAVLDYRALIEGEDWYGVARVPLDWLPPGLDRLNAFAIHGPPGARQHLACRGAPGPRPDFHRLETFGAFALIP